MQMRIIKWLKRLVDLGCSRVKRAPCRFSSPAKEKYLIAASRRVDVRLLRCESTYTRSDMILWFFFLSFPTRRRRRLWRMKRSGNHFVLSVSYIVNAALLFSLFFYFSLVSVSQALDAHIFFYSFLGRDSTLKLYFFFVGSDATGRQKKDTMRNLCCCWWFPMYTRVSKKEMKESGWMDFMSVTFWWRHRVRSRSRSPPPAGVSFPPMTHIGFCFTLVEQIEKEVKEMLLYLGRYNEREREEEEKKRTWANAPNDDVFIPERGVALPHLVKLLCPKSPFSLLFLFVFSCSEKNKHKYIRRAYGWHYSWGWVHMGVRREISDRDHHLLPFGHRPKGGKKRRRRRSGWGSYHLTLIVSVAYFFRFHLVD